MNKRYIKESYKFKDILNIAKTLFFAISKKKIVHSFTLNITIHCNKQYYPL